jgi:hypothetical protein
MSDLGAVLVANESRKRLERYTRGGRGRFELGRDILGYGKLTEGFHLPIFEWWWENRRAPFLLTMAGRIHYKTTMLITDLVADILSNPDGTHLVLHAIEEEAQKIVEECGRHFQKNPELRRLKPEIMPSAQAKKFLLSSQFTVRRKVYDRQATVMAKGIGSEMTGVHVNASIRLDDIIARRIIEDSGLPKVKAMFRNTIMPVRMPGCRVRATGTHWDPDDIYMDWRKDADWKCMVRAALETDGVPDYKGTPVLLTKQEIEIQRRLMGPDFAFQMMNDPSPAGEKAWDKETCEHFSSLKELGIGKGDFKVVLSDPAPAKIGSFFDDKKRVDGEKNEWATCTVALRRNGQREEVILLDGAASKEWEPDQGWAEVCRQKRTWETPYCSIEKTGQAVAFYTDTLSKVSRTMGVRHAPIDLTLTYKGKNQYFARLAEKARNGEFIIADSCPEAFVEQFLAQCRDWRALPGGRNNLKLDDRANCVSFATDPCFAGYARQVLPDVAWSPFKQAEGEEWTNGSRHVRW